MKRTLVLDEDDLIMVVKEDVVKQIDEYRGEMNRTEFVNYLIQCQLREMADRQSYMKLEDFQDFALQLTGMVREYLAPGRPETGQESLDRIESRIRAAGQP